MALSGKAIASTDVGTWLSGKENFRDFPEYFSPAQLRPHHRRLLVSTGLSKQNLFDNK